MKMPGNLKKTKTLTWAAVLLTSAGFCTPASADTFISYLFDLNSKQITQLGTLGGDVTQGNGINEAGQVAGNSNGRAFITGPNGGGMKDLGTLGGNASWGNAINNTGQVAGYAGLPPPVGGSHAFVPGANGAGMTDLGALEWFDSHAYGINDTGQVAGGFRRARFHHPP